MVQQRMRERQQPEQLRFGGSSQGSLACRTGGQGSSLAWPRDRIDFEGLRHRLGQAEVLQQPLLQRQGRMPGGGRWRVGGGRWADSGASAFFLFDAALELGAMLLSACSARVGLPSGQRECTGPRSIAVRVGETPRTGGTRPQPASRTCTSSTLQSTGPRLGIATLAVGWGGSSAGRGVDSTEGGGQQQGGQRRLRCRRAAGPPSCSGGLACPPVAGMAA